MRKGKVKIVPGLLCAYCGIEQATENEHVLPKQLIPTDERNHAKSGFVYAPACGSCNDRKATVETNFAHVLASDSGDYDHPSATKLLVGSIQNAVRCNNSRVGSDVWAPQIASAPELWLPSRQGGYELVTILSLTDEIAQERVEALQMIARGLINAAYDIIIPSTHAIRVLPVSYLKYKTVANLFSEGRIPIDDRVTGSIGEGIVEWLGAALFRKPDFSDLRGIICIEFYRRSLYFIAIDPLQEAI